MSGGVCLSWATRLCQCLVVVGRSAIHSDRVIADLRRNNRTGTICRHCMQWRWEVLVLRKWVGIRRFGGISGVRAHRCYCLRSVDCDWFTHKFVPHAWPILLPSLLMTARSDYCAYFFLVFLKLWPMQRICNVVVGNIGLCVIYTTMRVVTGAGSCPKLISCPQALCNFLPWLVYVPNPTEDAQSDPQTSFPTELSLSCAWPATDE